MIWRNIQTAIRKFTKIDSIIYESLEYLYRCTVYNLEVEDYHTYYVGQHGLWVHTPTV